MKQRFRKNDRLTASADFRRCYRHGMRLQTAFFTVYAHQAAQGGVRLGLAVGKSVGTAVVRNRVKRRLREIFRRHKASLPVGYDLFLRAAPASARGRYEALEAAFCEAMAGLSAREGATSQ